MEHLRNVEKLLKKEWKSAEKISIYQKCGCGCEVRPLQIRGARCVCATQKTVATHTLAQAAQIVNMFSHMAYKPTVYKTLDSSFANSALLAYMRIRNRVFCKCQRIKG